MKPVVLILVGLPGCGKTTASSFFRSQDMPVVRMGDLTDKELRRRNLPVSPDNERFIRNELRERFGEDIFAINIKKEAIKYLEKNKIVVIEGMRSEEELNYITRFFDNIKIITLKTKRSLRYYRLEHRKIRSLSRQETSKRDKEERDGYYKLKKQADFLVDNNGRISGFFKQLKTIIRSVSL